MYLSKNQGTSAVNVVHLQWTPKALPSGDRIIESCFFFFFKSCLKRVMRIAVLCIIILHGRLTVLGTSTDKSVMVTLKVLMHDSNAWQFQRRLCMDVMFVHGSLKAFESLGK